jgi:hypothetical protein
MYDKDDHGGSHGKEIFCALQVTHTVSMKPIALSFYIDDCVSETYLLSFPLQQSRVYGTMVMIDNTGSATLLCIVYQLATA